MYDFDKDWTKEQLMGRTMAQEEKECGKKLIGKGVKADPMLWGVPGHLTSEEADVFFRFKDAVETRGPDFKDTIYCFGEIEGEVWALCRWLRARKFDFDKVMEMIDEANQTRAEAKKMDFYPNPTDALGVDKSLFFAQFPQLYSGSAKNGSTLFFSKPGVLNVDGIQCLTTLNGIIEFHWYIMMHDFAQRLRAKKEADPENFKRSVVCAAVSVFSYFPNSHHSHHVLPDSTAYVFWTSTSLPPHNLRRRHSRLSRPKQLLMEFAFPRQ